MKNPESWSVFAAGRASTTMKLSGCARMGDPAKYFSYRLPHFGCARACHRGLKTRPRYYGPQANGEAELKAWNEQLESRVLEHEDSIAGRSQGAQAVWNRRLPKRGRAERLRLGQELHDGLAQELTALGMMLDVLEQKLVKTSPARSRNCTSCAEYLPPPSRKHALWRRVSIRWRSRSMDS